LNPQKQKEIEPHCGESLCRLFDLITPVSNVQILEEQTRINMLNEVIENLTVIIGKSKLRHVELASENLRHRSSSKSDSKDRELNGDEKKSEKHSSDEEEGSRRAKRSSPTSDSKYSSSYDRHRKDYQNSSYNSSSYRLEF
jgi:hypothetical protein